MKKKFGYIRKVVILILTTIMIPLSVAIGFVALIRPPVQPFAPIAWKPDPAFSIGVEKTDLETSGFTSAFTEEKINGPEDVAVDKAGIIYTGVQDGKILRILPEQGQVEVFANLGGRPLGLLFDQYQHLIVANPGIGLQSVSPEGDVTLLANVANGKPILFANDLAIGDNGIIYFSDSNWKYNPATLGDQPSFSFYDFLEGQAQGRLLSYDPATKTTAELLSDLYFPNGVVVTRDQQAVLVAESTRYRITKYWLAGDKAGMREVFLDNIPGILDGLTLNEEGHLLLPMYERVGFLDRYVLPHFRMRHILVRMPWIATVGGSPEGVILVLSENREIVRYIKNIQPAPSNIIPYRNQWLLGTLSGELIRTVPVGKW